MPKLKDYLERYLMVWLILLSAIAYGWNRSGLPDVFLASKAYLPWLIAITMFAIGAMLPKDEVRQVFSRWPTVFGGTAVQYGAMPLLAYVFGKQFGLDHELFVGVMMVGCVPGAMASNVLTLLAKGNTSYSVSLTTVATLISPIMVPLALHWTLGESVPSSKFQDAARSLLVTVVIPVVAGHVMSRSLPALQPRIAIAGPIVANCSILWIIAFVVAANRSRMADVPALLLLTLMLLNAGGYCAGFVGGRLMQLNPSMRRALTLEVGMQNAGLGTALVASLFPDQPLVTIPPALYTFGCMLTGTALARAWAAFPVELPSNER